MALRRPTLARYDALAGLLILAGAVLLGGNLGWAASLARLWPVFVLLAGGALIVAGLRRGPLGGGPVGAGTFLVLTAVLFQYLSLVGWEQMEACWPLFVGFLGASIFASGVGGRLRGPVLFLSAVLVLLSLVFFLVFTIDPALWPLSLVLFGLSLLLLGRTSDAQADRAG